jgi:hypothetical protein
VSTATGERRDYIANESGSGGCFVRSYEEVMIAGLFLWGNQRSKDGEQQFLRERSRRRDS